MNKQLECEDASFGRLLGMLKRACRSIDSLNALATAVRSDHDPVSTQRDSLLQKDQHFSLQRRTDRPVCDSTTLNPITEGDPYDRAIAPVTQVRKRRCKRKQK